ncbi:MAG: DegT/DnrJ/EryC1/StrS family aminotransferase [Promethearchaeota archaeon]
MISTTAIPIDNEEIVATFSSLFKGADSAHDDVIQFERDLAAYLGSKNVFASNTGRAALYAALQALDLKRGDEVIVPAYTCAIVFEVILRLGLKPILVDADLQTYNINPELIPEVVSSKTKAIIPVHLFGRPCEMTRIMEIANENSLYVIEDVAQALGAEHKKVKVGTFGDLAIFSFGPGKSMTSGEGGALSVNNGELEEKVKAIEARWPNPDFGWTIQSLKNIVGMKVFSNPYLYTFIRHFLEQTLNVTDKKISENCLRLLREQDTINLNPTVLLTKMPRLSAEVARIQLRKLDELNQRRIMNAVNLTELLNVVANLVQLPRTSHDGKNTFTRYPIRMLKGSRNEVIKRLIEGGVDAGKPYHYLGDLLKLLSGKAPGAITLANSILTIPNHPLLKAPDILKIADTFSNQLNVRISQ